MRKTEREAKSPSMFDQLLAVVRQIPRGKVSTYGAVAKAAGYPGAARQVVWALHSRKGLPWHRVLGSGGTIRIPGEDGLEQNLRLRSEGVAFKGTRVDMERHEFQFSGQQRGNFAVNPAALNRAPGKRPPANRKFVKRPSRRPS